MTAEDDRRAWAEVDAALGPYCPGVWISQCDVCDRIWEEPLAHEVPAGILIDPPTERQTVYLGGDERRCPDCVRMAGESDEDPDDL